MALHEKVMKAVRDSLGHAVDALEDLPGGRVSGIVVSRSFEGLDHQRRQAILNTALKERLSATELAKVGAIAALTPKEANVKAV